jgi:hypothetical protein
MGRDGVYDPPDGQPQALLLEVKYSKDRGFIVSPGEWRTAERERGDYAFLIVLRGSDRPLGMELLPDPVALHEEGRLTRTEDGWVVAYRLGEAG